MSKVRYEIEINDYQTSLALRYLLLENFDTERFEFHHTADGNTAIKTVSIKLKPDKWNNKFYHDPKYN